MADNNSKNGNNGISPERKSAVNIALNSLIFLLFVLIVYMVYSLSMKFIGEEKIPVQKNDSEVPAEIIQIEVLNGCGVSGVADRFTDYLRSKDFDVVTTGNFETYDLPETLVIDRIGNMANARKTAEILGVDKKNVIQQINEDYFLDVSLIIGKDYSNLTPIKTD